MTSSIVRKNYFFRYCSFSQYNVVSRHSVFFVVVFVLLFFFSIGPTMSPSIGPAKEAANRRNPPIAHLLCPPMYPRPFVIDHFLIIQNNHLLTLKNMFYVGVLNRPLLVSTSIHSLNIPIC